MMDAIDQVRDPPIAAALHQHADLYAKGSERWRQETRSRFVAWHVQAAIAQAAHRHDKAPRLGELAQAEAVRQLADMPPGSDLREAARRLANQVLGMSPDELEQAIAPRPFQKRRRPRGRL